LCDKHHAFLPSVVEVKSAGDYSAWTEGKQQEMLANLDDPNKEWTLAELQARGEKVYASNCVACHQASGQGVPGAFPSLIGSAKVVGPVADQIAILLNGVQGAAMASFKQLSDVELAAVATYTRNAWGNQAEESIIQPKQFMQAR